jgi:hypothetical protein
MIAKGILKSLSVVVPLGLLGLASSSSMANTIVEYQFEFNPSQSSTAISSVSGTLFYDETTGSAVAQAGVDSTFNVTYSYQSGDNPVLITFHDVTTGLAVVSPTVSGFTHPFLNGDTGLLSYSGVTSNPHDQQILPEGLADIMVPGDGLVSGHWAAVESVPDTVLTGTLLLYSLTTMGVATRLTRVRQLRGL